MEAGVGARHHRPVLRPHHVVGADGVPQHHVGVLQCGVVGDVLRQPLGLAALVHVVPRGESLALVVLRDPEVVLHEAGAVVDERALLHHHRHHLPGQQLVADGLAELVAFCRIDHLPVPAGLPVPVPRALRFGGHQRVLGDPRVAVRIEGRIGFGNRVHFVDAVARAVDAHVQPEVEEVLMVGSVDVGRDHLSPPRSFTVGHRAGGQHTGKLDFHLDRRVVVEVPEEAVLVVAHSADHRDDQAPRPTYLDFLGAEVGVLPRDAVILFVHADRVGDSDRVPRGVVDRAVEVMDLAEAVTPEGQRVG